MTEEQKRNQQRKLLADFGYTIQSDNAECIGALWWALLPGETELFDDDGDPPKQNYLGFFSNENDLLDEISGDLELERSDQIKKEYLSSGCQQSDVADAVNKLMAECASLFEDDDMALAFLMEF